MKRMILFLAVLSASLFSAQAEPENAKNLYRQNYDFRDFTALSVSHIFKVDLRFADAWSVEVEVPDYIEPYLDVNCREGKVRIGYTMASQFVPTDGSAPVSLCPSSFH